MPDKVREGHVVKSFNLGITRVKICDDYCRDKTAEDVEKILKKITWIAQNAFSAATAQDGGSTPYGNQAT